MKTKLMKGTYDVTFQGAARNRKQYITPETHTIFCSQNFFLLQTAKYDCSCTFQHLRVPLSLWYALTNYLILMLYLVLSPCGIDGNLHFFSNILGVLDELPTCKVKTLEGKFFFQNKMFNIIKFNSAFQ